MKREYLLSGSPFFLYPLRKFIRSIEVEILPQCARLKQPSFIVITRGGRERLGSFSRLGSLSLFSLIRRGQRQLSQVN